MSHILIAGLGDLGSDLARTLREDGHQVSAIRRSGQGPEGIQVYAQDLLQGAPVLPAAPVDLLVIVLTPSEYSEAGYQATYMAAPARLLDALSERQPLPPTLFVSSTAVYGDLHGDVDEDTTPAPRRYNGRIMLAAEEAIGARAPATAVRFSGIYGPGRTRLLRKVERVSLGQEPAPAPVWTNRIHREDCVGLLHALARRWLAGQEVSPVVVGTDNHPVSNLAVYRHLAALHGWPLTLEERPPTGKRLFSRFIAEGGYRLRYPDYRQGYQALSHGGRGGGAPSTV